MLCLGIPKVVTGALNISSCEIQSLVPTYMIVSGVAPLYFGGFIFRNSDEMYNSKDYFGGVCGIVGSLFNFIWLMCGTAWVFPTFVKMSYVNFQVCTHNNTVNCNDKGCSKGFLTFAVTAVALDWILIGCMLVIIGYSFRKYRRN